jgi:hypothetical protein
MLMPTLTSSSRLQVEATLPRLWKKLASAWLP